MSPLGRINRRLQQWREATALTADAQSRARLGAAMACWAIQRRTGSRLISAEPVVSLRRFGQTCSIQLRSPSEVALALEIIAADEYDVALPATAKTILDLGANIGMASAYFRLRYPDAALFAVEPEPVLFAQLSKNSRLIGGAIDVRPWAVTDQTGPLDLYCAAGMALSASIHERTQTKSCVTVQGRTLDDIFEALDLDEVDLLKVDIEGAELAALAGRPCLSRVHHIVLEYHQDLVGMDPASFVEQLPGFELVGTRSLSAMRSILSLSR